MRRWPDLAQPLCSSSDILLLGPTAIHGYALARRYPNRVRAIHSTNKRDAKGLGWPYIELEDITEMARLLARFKGTIVYAHAVCDVQRCEEHPDWAYQKNIRNLEGIVQAHHPEARFVYLSSDHAFGEDGVYDEDSDPCPLSSYARSRIQAERIALAIPGSLVVRVPLSIGPSVTGRVGHLDWIRYRHDKGLPITIIEDEARSAISAAAVADRIIALCDSDITGLRHIAATRSVLRTELADAVFAYHGIPPTYNLATRCQQPAPHLGRITIATRHTGPLADPLPSAVDILPTAHPEQL